MKNLPKKMFEDPVRSWRALLGGGLLALGAVGLSQPVAADLSPEEKRIQVTGKPRGGDLHLAFDPLKASYRVGEPIRFRVRGNRDFYLYVYNVDEETGEAVLILPNQHQKRNKYRARRWQTVPNRNLEFYADRPGYERIILVASTRYVDIDTARYKTVGDFFSTSARQLEEDFAAKEIRIRRGQRDRRMADVSVQELELRISGRALEVAAELAAPRAVAFVATGRRVYDEGERVEVVYGANRSGWVHLYTVEPGGGYDLLKREKVNGKALYELRARAEAPYGEHALVAVYTADRDFDEGALEGLYGARYAKGLSLVGGRDGDLVTAVHRFRIRR